MTATVGAMATSHVRFSLLAAVLAVPALALAGCAADAPGGEGDVVDTSEDLTSTITVPAYGSRTLHLRATATRDVTLTLDCHPPEHPDEIGPVVQVTAPSLGLTGSGPAPAGYFQAAVNVTEGTHDVTLANAGPQVACSLRLENVPEASTCRSWTSWRSANADHTHYVVGSEGAAAGWEPFPASGNHWGAWAPWNTVYERPVKRGFLLHNLEHGGLVFSYRCSGPDESSACKSAADGLVDLANALGLSRVIVTPDPTQPTMFAVRAWRWAYTAECLDAESAGAFARARIRHGREDIDADPPIPFDPTTLDVPCNDLMAAPDSCN